MTFSSLISGTVPHHDKYNRRPGKVTRVIQHHWADTTMGGENSLASAGRRASVNYLVHNDGAIKGQVPEEFRPWTSSSAAADNPSITIEVQNETGGPEWKVSDAARNSIARLIADIAIRHGFGSLNRTNYRGHREFASTACPGPYLYPRLQSVCDAANKINAGPTPNPAPTPTEESMWKDLKLAKLKTSPEVYVGDGLVRRHIANQTELTDISYIIKNAGGDATVLVVDEINWLGVDITPVKATISPVSTATKASSGTFTAVPEF